MPTKKTINEFIEKARKIHNDKYGYQKFDYQGAIIPGIITCPSHGEFKQRPNNHLSGSGCKKCMYEKQALDRKKSINTFIKEANKINNNKYNYSQVKYINARTKVKIICPIHGEFEQKPVNHLAGTGCVHCSETQFNNDVAIDKFKQIHGDKYDYSCVKYLSYNKKISIICKAHGKFLQSPRKHIEGRGCPKCGLVKRINSRRLLNQDFINKANKIHNNRYDYSQVKYINTYTRVKIICPIHGEFKQKPNYHLLGSGCPVCNISKGEKAIARYLNINNIKYTQQKRFTECKDKAPLKFDFFLPEYNLCIEFNGEQHYQFVKHFHRTEDVFKRSQNRDKIKKNYCRRSRIKLVTIAYNQISRIDSILDKVLNHI